MVILRFLLPEALGHGLYYLLLLVAIVVCARAGGSTGAIAAATLGCIASLLLTQHQGWSLSAWDSLAPFLFASAALIYFILSSAREHHQAENLRGEASTAHRELDLLLDSAVEYAICLLDCEGRVVIWNAGAERMFGWSEAEAVGQILDQLTAMPEDGDTCAAAWTTAMRTGSFSGRLWQRRRGGDTFLAEVVLSRIDGDDGGIVGFGKVVRDVTEEQMHRDAIAAREAQLRSILTTVPDAMVVTDENGIIQSFSAAAQQLFGYAEAEALGQDVAMLMPSPDRDWHDTYIARHRVTGEGRVLGSMRRVLGRRKDGSILPLELAIGEACGGGQRVYTGFIRDLTAREAAEERQAKLQAELLHVSRLSAVGTLAGSLAHELNQPLTAVANYVQTAEAMVSDLRGPLGGTLRQALAEAGSEALRAGAIVRHLRQFIARGEIDRTNETIQPLIEDALALCALGSSADAPRCRLKIGADVGPVLVDRVQIQQVLVNLLRNAAEAIGKRGGGRVDIVVVPDGDMVCVSVADNGPGIAPEIAEGLFNAFNTTKLEGIGLGLSICKRIIEAHGGKIWSEPRKGRGTRFHFTLPRAGMEVADG